MKIKTFLFVVILLILGCKNAPRQYVVLDYEDFGPQSMAWETIGMQWWQWDNHGDSNPNSKYAIKVVVYRDTSLKQIESLFPVDKAKKQDFRYIDYREAIRYLDRNIIELEGINEEWIAALKQRLIKTKKRIEQELEFKKLTNDTCNFNKSFSVRHA